MISIFTALNTNLRNRRIFGKFNPNKTEISLKLGFPRNNEKNQIPSDWAKNDHPKGTRRFLKSVRLFLKNKKANPNIPNKLDQAPLHVGAEKGDIKLIELLVAKAYGKQGVDGKAPLHWAIEKGDINTVNLLLAAGTNPNTPSKLGQTPLYLAVQYGHTNVIELLLAAGADLNIPDHWEQTPLHLAVKEGKEDLVHRLLAVGADPNIPDHWGRTALHLAVKESYKEGIKLLLGDLKTSLSVKDNGGMVPFDYAHVKKDEETQNLLIKHMAYDKVPLPKFAPQRCREYYNRCQKDIPSKYLRRMLADGANEKELIAETSKGCSIYSPENIKLQTEKAKIELIVERRLLKIVPKVGKENMSKTLPLVPVEKVNEYLSHEDRINFIKGMKLLLSPQDKVLPSKRKRSVNMRKA